MSIVGWTFFVAFDGSPCAVVHPTEGRVIPVRPKSPHPAHIGRAVSVAKGLWAQLNDDGAVPDLVYHRRYLPGRRR